MKMFRYWVGLVFVLSTILASVVNAQAPSHRRQLFRSFFWQDEANEFATIENIKGKYSDRGWQSLVSGYDGSRLQITMKNRMPQSATLEWTLKNYDPPAQCQSPREHLFFMTSSENDQERFYDDGSWFYLRTGTAYVNGDGSTSMKIDVGSKGTDTRTERFVFENQKWDVNATYWFKIIYDNYYMWIYFNDQLLITLDFPGQVKRFNQISFAGDGEYPSMAGPIFSDFSISTYENQMYYLDKTVTKNAAGLERPGYGGHGIAVGDVNGDGLEDLYLGNCVQNQCLRDVLYIQQPDGTFRDETFERGVLDECCSHAVIFFDVDNDGDLDLFNANTWEPNQLYINDGAGYFTEESFARGIENINGETRGAVAFDVNNDGFIDIFAVNWGMQNEMYINQGDGTFRREYRGAEGAVEDTEKIGTQGVTVADIDNDGDYDIYISKRDAANELYLNENGYFRNVAAERGVAVGDRSDGATFADFDGDGDMDLFVSNTRIPNTLHKIYLNVFENTGNGFFQDKTLEHNLLMEGFTPLLLDANNDGHLDLYRLRNNDYDRASVAVLSLGDGEGGFKSAGYNGATIIGADARSVVAHDFDGDGDLDFYVTTKLFENVYLENRSAIASNNWIEISTIGPRGDLGGIGSKIEVYKTGQLGVPSGLRGYREVVTQQGYLSSGSYIQHFGLGDHTSCDVRVILTDGTVIEERNVSANQRIVIAGEQSYKVLHYVSGNNQTGVVNQLLPQPLKVRVTDQDGVPITGATVTFAVTQGDGAIDGASDGQTDTNGYAAVNFRLGSTEGQHKVEARVNGAQNSPVEFSATAQAAALTLIKVSGDNQSGQVGTALSQQLVVQAGYDNGGIAANVDVTCTVISGGGTVDGAPSTSVQTDEFGRAAISWTLGTVSGQQLLQASVTGASVDFYATATAGAPASLVNISGAGQTLEPGVPFPQPFVAKVADVFGNPVANHPVAFSVIAGGGTVNGAAQVSVSTDQQGVARATWTPGPYLGPANSLHASSAFQGTDLAGSPVSWSFPGVDVSASNSTVSASSPVPADGVSTSTIVVTLRNSQNQPVGAGLTVDISADGSGNTLQIANPQSDANGQVTASLSSVVGETKVIRAMVKGLELELASQPSVEFQAIDQTPDVIQIVSGNNQNVVVNQTSQPLVVRVLDTERRPVVNHTVTFIRTIGEGTIDGQKYKEVQTGADGTASVIFQTDRVAGIVSHIEARAAEVTNSPVTFTLTSVAAEPRALVIVSGNNQQGPPHTELPQQLAVRVQDAYNNAIVNHPVHFKVNIGQCLVNGAPQITVYTDATGVARASVVTGEQQGQCIIEAKTDFSSVTFTLMVTEGLPDPDLKLSTLTATSPVLADGVSASDIVVTIFDKFDRPIEGMKIKLSVMGEGAKLSQPDSLTNSNGQLFAKLASTVAGEKVVFASVLPQELYLEQTATVVFERGNPTVEIVSGHNQSGTVGQQCAEPLVVLLKNGNNPFVGQYVRFTVESGTGHFSGRDTLLVTTDAQGLASAEYFFGTESGVNVVRAATPIAPDKGVTFEMTANADVAAKLVKHAGDEQTGRVNAPLEGKLAVLVTDTYGNPASGASVVFSAIDGGSIAAPQTVNTDAAGLAHATAICGDHVGQYTFKAELPNSAFVLFSATAEQSNSAPLVVSYLPVENELRFSYNDRLVFEVTQVFDADNDPIYYYWHINNQMVGNQSKLLLFMSPVFGASNSLVCTVTDGLDSTFVIWSLQLDTRVQLSSFNGSFDKKTGVLLNWTTASETDNLGFRLLRAASEHGDFEPITERLIKPSSSRTYQVVDTENLQPGDYFYMLESISASGPAKQHGPISVNVHAPEKMALLQNYPNPFNPTTTFAFELPATSHVSLVIYNQKGQLVRELVGSDMSAGRHTVVWDAKDAFGVQVPTGIYLYRMTADDFSETKKLTLLK